MEVAYRCILSTAEEETITLNSLAVEKAHPDDQEQKVEKKGEGFISYSNMCRDRFDELIKCLFCYCCRYCCLSSRMLLLCMIISSTSAFSFHHHSFLSSSSPSSRLLPSSYSLFLSPPAVFVQPFGKEEDDSVVSDNIISSLSNYIKLHSILSSVFCISIVILSNSTKCKLLYDDFVAFCNEKNNNFMNYVNREIGTISGAIILSSIILVVAIGVCGIAIAGSGNGIADAINNFKKLH